MRDPKFYAEDDKSQADPEDFSGWVQFLPGGNTRELTFAELEEMLPLDTNH